MSDAQGEGVFAWHGAAIREVERDPKDGTLTRVIVGKNRRVNVPTAEVEKLGIAPGAAWTPELEAACAGAMELRRALRRAGGLLKTKDRASDAVRVRLEEAGFDAATAAAAVERLKAAKLIDDEALAAKAAESLDRRGPLSPEALRERLMREGLSDEAIDEVVGDRPGPEVTALADAKLLAARAKPDASPAARWRRVMAGLARHGYDETVALDAARAVLGEPPEDVGNAGEP